MQEEQIINTELLLSLRTDFELEDVSLDEYIGGTKIKVIPESKDELEISNPHATFKIKMRLDKRKKKVITTHLQNRVTHEYEIKEIGSDVFIVRTGIKIDWEIERKFGGREQIDSLVYRMVSTIGRAGEEQRSGFRGLTRVVTFSNMVDDVYTQFEQGRSVLLELRR